MNKIERHTPTLVAPLEEKIKPANVLTLPAARGARLVAVLHLDAAVAAYQRLDHPEDIEALHDFRVALRRLRSCLQAYKTFLSDTVSKKSQKRLVRLARVTNEARDTEVQLEWLRLQEKKLPVRQRHSWVWLVQRLDERKAKAYGEIRAKVTKQFLRLEPKLRAQLQKYTVFYELVSEPERMSFGMATGMQIKQYCKSLEKNQRKIDASNDELAIHASRIWVKRLRYLLEPVQEEIEDWQFIMDGLKDLQNLLGKLHDTQIMAAEIACAVEVSAGVRARCLLDLALDDAESLALLAKKRRSEHAGLVTLASFAKMRSEASFAELAVNYLNGGLDALIRRILQVGYNLSDRAVTT